MDRLSRLLCLQFEDDRTGVSLDLSRMGFSRAELSSFAAPMAAAFEEMRALEAGMVVNRDEDRRVGHYWLRDPELAPGELAEEIRRGFEKIRDFAGRVLDAGIPPPRGGRYRQLCLIGIGGSALGPQFLAEALHEPGQGLSLVTLDNSDPDGIRRSLKRLELPETLFVVISKSGGTLETRNGMLEARAALQEADLDLARQAVAITMAGSKLDRLAESEGWLQRFPLKDWVGGRTSITSAAGLLPAALMGIDVKSFLNGARAMDENTRRAEHDGNLAALMASAWHLALHGASRRNLVVLPYRDRLALLGRYLQQLVMESLGKELDRRGRIVHQGLTVYGNK
ncbi:MAG: glucose-6-phosphate isomerase, partial [Planctomycetota bacterium]